MKENFDKCVAFVLDREGNYSNNAADPGGETKFGISKKAFPHLDIKNITQEQAVEIYKAVYWDTIHGDDLEWPLDAIAFDTCVNQGRGVATSLLTSSDSWQDFLFLRIKRYTELGKKYPQFLRGWLVRVVTLYEWIKRG